MNFDTKLRNRQYGLIWEEYCGFINLSMDEYMEIQQRLMKEQLTLYAGCELGKGIMPDMEIKSIEEFREKVPLTTYEDYADVLLHKNETALPIKPVTWIETTWEGGKHPVKVAPYTEGMINSYRDSFIAAMIFSTSSEKGKFKLRSRDKFLYAMASLPYLSGIVPNVLDSELSIEFMPEKRMAQELSFIDKNIEGFKLGMQKGIDLLFGLSSIITKMSEDFPSKLRSAKINYGNCSTGMASKLAAGWFRSKALGKNIKPKDIWKPKGIICVGTDSVKYKKEIEKYWGIRPTEIFGGTECACISTETHRKNGMIFFPDVCFYEFIPYSELEKNLENADYWPKTYLMDELVEGESYELVISNFKGGAFMRYRLGEMFRCLSKSNEDELKIPKFEYVDKVPSIIDIAGFTKITEATINETISMSKLCIHDWVAVKEYDEKERVYMHLYIEEEPSDEPQAMSKGIIKEHLSIYFKYIDSDYRDLKKIFGIDPLVVSIIPTGSIENYEKENGKKIRRVNPSSYDITGLLKFANTEKEVGC